MSGQGIDDTPAFARAHLTDHIELRVLIPKYVVGAIDGAVINRGGESANVYRATIVAEILTPWAEKQRHDAMVLLRTMGINPTGSESVTLPVVDVMHRGRS